MTPGRTGPLILAAGSMLDQPASVLLEAAASAGFDGVGLRLSGEHATDDTVALGARATELGLVIHDAEVHRIGAGTDPAHLIEQTAAIGATALLVVSDLPDRDLTAAAVAELAERCHRRGLRVGLEYMAWTTPSTPREAIEIARTTGCELVVDLLHHVRVGADPAAVDEIVDAGVLGWVQLCDAPAASPADGDLVREARHGRLPPGQGALPLGDLLARVPDRTVISVEVQSDALATASPHARARLLHDASRSVLSG